MKHVDVPVDLIAGFSGKIEKFLLSLGTIMDTERDDITSIAKQDRGHGHRQGERRRCFLAMAIAMRGMMIGGRRRRSRRSHRVLGAFARLVMDDDDDEDDDHG